VKYVLAYSAIGLVVGLVVSIILWFAATIVLSLCPSPRSLRLRI
jgi:hypothetical protein